jgi:hypothetical protein
MHHQLFLILYIFYFKQLLIYLQKYLRKNNSLNTGDKILWIFLEINSGRDRMVGMGRHRWDEKGGMG